jgi:hypothetical protein
MNLPQLKEDIKRKLQYFEESRQPMAPRAKQEQRCLVKGKEVRNLQFENQGHNR